VIEFHLDARSGVAPYLQLIHQVRHALRLGLLRKGDQLPTVKEVVARTLNGGSLAAHAPLRQELRRWLATARRAGLDDDSIEALFLTTFRSAAEEEIA